MSDAPRRRAISTPGERRDPARRGPGSIALSVALHVVAVLVLVRLTVIPGEWLMDVMKSTPTPVERIGFLQLPKGEAPKEAPRRGGDDRPLTAALRSAPPQPVAPVEVPRGLPPIPNRKVTDEPPIGGTGPLVGGGGDTRGVRPSYADPRVWAPSAPVVTAPLSAQERLDSAVAAMISATSDSIRRANGGRDPNDWTFKVGGQKFGIDKQFIRLGPVSIPTPLLALLPLNVQANPMTVEHDRRLASMRTEILDQAARAARDADFHAAVTALRERKQKERDDAKKADPPPSGKIIP